MKRTALLFIFLILPNAAAAQEPDISKFVDSRYDETARIARTLWEYAEVGYQEKKSSELLQATLAAEGFNVQPGVAGMPTAFVASYGETGPVIAILSAIVPGIISNQGSKATSVDRSCANTSMLPLTVALPSRI